LSYPPPPRADTGDQSHDELVADPFRRLEELNDPAIRRWIDLQNKLTREYLDQLPSLAAIRQRLQRIWRFERFGVPWKEDGRYFFTRNDGLQNQGVLYVAESLRAKPKILLDPNRFSTDGTVHLSGATASRDGKWLAYGTSKAGSDWQDWKIRNVDTGRDLPETLRWIKFSHAVWHPSSGGFFYSRYEEPTAGAELSELNFCHRVYYHKLGTPQTEDRLVYERPDQPEWGFEPAMTDDGRFLLLFVWHGTAMQNRFFIKDLEEEHSPVVELLSDGQASYVFVGNKGQRFWFRTDHSAPRGRIIELDLARPEPDNWRTVIPEREHMLDGVRYVGGRFVACYLKDAQATLIVHDIEGRPLYEIGLPAIGSVHGLSGKSDGDEIFFAFTSVAFPDTILRHDVKSRTTTTLRRPKVDFKSGDFETFQFFCCSRDGTPIPIFVSGRKGWARSQPHPLVLSGYGGFGFSEVPSFSPATVTWMEMGGLWATVVARGGGEYGEEWHRAGQLENKPNVFDDYVAAAEFLIEQRITASHQLAGYGASNGGLLVAAVLNQRPELLKAAVIVSGVLDMLRFHKFTLGWAWIPEYGSPDNPDHYKILRGYSPVHNITSERPYPPVLVAAADHDDRVVPCHSLKYAAALQEAHPDGGPFLLRVDTFAGHGESKPVNKLLDEYADMWTFLAHHLQMELPADYGAT
jgi:prolyl oligopeptidase